MIKEGSCDVTNIPELGAILEVDGKVGTEANESLAKFVEFVIELVDWCIEKGLICDADFKLELVAALDAEGMDDTTIEEFLELFGFWEEICDATCKPDLDIAILGVDGDEIIEDELCEGFVEVSIGVEFVIAIVERAWVWGGITDDLDNGGFIGATNKPETVGIEVLDVEGNDDVTKSKDEFADEVWQGLSFDDVCKFELVVVVLDTKGKYFPQMSERNF